MKNIVKIIIVIFIASLSFGFIIHQKPESNKDRVEKPTLDTGGHSSEMKVLHESNDDQW